MTRAGFVAATAAALTIPAATELAAAAAVARSAAALVYVGSNAPNAAGISVYAFDRGSGALTRVSMTTDIKNPAWLALHPNQARLYVASEADVIDGVRAGTVTSYVTDPSSGALDALNTVSTRGTASTHLSVHPSGRYAFVANYASGSVTVLPILADGRLGEPSDIAHGDGPLHLATASDDPPGNLATSDHSRSHMHMVAADPSGRFVVANDAGLDRTYIWRLDLLTGTLIPAATPVVDAVPGSAPRHFAFHPNGRVMYNLHEHDAMLATFSFDPLTGALTCRGRQSILPAGFAGSNLASDVIVSADGRFVYAANRLHDTVAVFATDAAGRLTPLGEHWTYADYPCSIAIDPTGRFLFSCNRHSDSITAFKRDPNTGMLAFTGDYIAIGTPVSMVFSG